MTTQISPNDWQALSAYLDGQLPERDKRQLEARLQTSTELRDGLEELRRTRALLRSLPRKRAPRSFAITPAMVAAYQQKTGKAPRKSFWQMPLLSFPSMRLASALATFLLVITFLSDLAIQSAQLTGSPALPQAAPAAAEMEDSATGEMEVYSLPAEPADPGQDPATGAGGSAPEATPDPSLRLMVEEPTFTPEEIARMTAAPPGMGGAIAESGPALAAPPPTEAADAGSLKLPEPDPAGSAANQEMAADPAPASFDPRSILVPLQIFLAILALTTGAIALWLRRQIPH